MSKKLLLQIEWLFLQESCLSNKKKLHICYTFVKFNLNERTFFASPKMIHHHPSPSPSPPPDKMYESYLKVC